MVTETGRIEIRDVGCRFVKQDGRQMTALEDIRLTIEPGSFVSVIGPSGCGKSTLLRIVAGLQKASAGEVRLDGTPVTGPGYERGLVFQDPTLFPWLTVQENIASGLVARGVYKARRREIPSYIRLVGLQGFEKSYPHQLSGGMAQRVAIARALINRPKVLLLDEPLGALDAFTRIHMQDELLRIWQERRNTVVLVTHDVDEAIYLGDRVVVMSPRPGHVQEVIPVNLPEGKDRGSGAFRALRERVLAALHFTEAG
ncbi:MAG TPA: ABC transporter ATP-binding protein [Ruminococcaceae bacterium]|jgi:ABC-type nitrate/sulfonate/bicarbonate transport system ATPase subunit|nr:ABC transporter ATP-binding protein [Oscillospiraceae bacterium]HBQ45831.1 ABC transporter ATP-binding protein [Oscillospiraceae bacterium]